MQIAETKYNGNGTDLVLRRVSHRQYAEIDRQITVLQTLFTQKSLKSNVGPQIISDCGPSLKFEGQSEVSITLPISNALEDMTKLRASSN